jgi:creatinine amidohydrolase
MWRDLRPMTRKRPILLDETPYKLLRRLSIEVAILPWGSVEAHNTHLPCGTDIMEARMIGREAARIACERGAKVLVLPAIPFGVNTGQFDVPGTINMNPSTQMAVLEDVVTSIEHQRIPKLVVLNGHGGNEFKWMIRELQPKHRIFLSALNWWTIVDARK